VKLRFDIELPGRGFLRGVPFIFVRNDNAGNVLKRQLTNVFHFSRLGGSCPLWSVHDTFTRPGLIVTQIARRPDGRSLGQHKSFAIGLGRDLVHADQPVYSTGVALDDPSTAVSIGAGCKICNRSAGAQRAFPDLGGRVPVDENTGRGLPYSPATRLA